MLNGIINDEIMLGIVERESLYEELLTILANNISLQQYSIRGLGLISEALLVYNKEKNVNSSVMSNSNVKSRIIVNNGKYFIDQIHSTKANQFTKFYHYSHQGFRKAAINLGVFRHSDNKMVGCMQWGVSSQENIKLGQYIKQPLKRHEYMELNRFCMDDDEGKNSESQAISLGIKWIKKNMPEVRMLISYAGRKEGNFGYIYQATSWEYLGYFTSASFWFIDGYEKHMKTIGQFYKLHCDQSDDKSRVESLCEKCKDLRQTWTKQFVYVQRLDKNLELACDIKPYPKPDTDGPIKVSEKIFKQDDNMFKNPIFDLGEKPVYYFNGQEKHLFAKQTLIKQGNWDFEEVYVAYDPDGKFIRSWNMIKEIKIDGCTKAGIQKALRSPSHRHNQYYFYKYDAKVPFPPEIKTDIVAVIDGQRFYTCAEIGRYLGVSRQAVFQAQKLHQTTIKGKICNWK